MTRTRFTEQLSFCVAPWLSLHLDPEGKRRLCCVADRAPESASALTAGEFLRSDYLKAVRSQMRNGTLPPECAACAHPNRARAAREDLNERFASHFSRIEAGTKENGEISWGLEGIHHVDYRSHGCNLRCKTCGPDNSSAWLAELNRSGGDWQSFAHPSYLGSIRRNVRDSPYEKEFLFLVENASLEEIYFAGGEPLLSASHDKALELLVQSGRARNLRLSYNTNLAIPSAGFRRWLGRLSHFRSVEILCSLDGIGAVGEYIRTGLSLSRFEENLSELLEFRDQTKVFVCLDVTLTSLLLADTVALAEFALRHSIPVFGRRMIPREPRAFLGCDFLSRSDRRMFYGRWRRYYESLDLGQQELLRRFDDLIASTLPLPEISPEEKERRWAQSRIYDRNFSAGPAFSDLLQRTTKLLGLATEFPMPSALTRSWMPGETSLNTSPVK